MNRSHILLVSFILFVLAIFAGKGLLYPSGSSEEMTWNFKLMFLGAINISLILGLIFKYEKSKRFIPYVLAFYIANTGFTYEYKTGYQTSANEVLTFVIFIIWIVKRALPQKAAPSRPYFFKNAGIFLLLSVAGVITAYFIFKVEPLNILTLFKSYTLYLFYLFLIPDCIESEKELHRVLIFILIVSLYPLYCAVTGSMSIENIAEERLSVTGWGTLNIFVGYILPILLVASGLLFYGKAKWQKLLILLYLSTTMYVLILSQTRTGWAALAVGIGLFLFMAKKKLPAFVIGVILAIGLLYFPLGENVKNVVTQRIFEQTLNPDTSLRERYSRWEGAWDTAKTYPLTGSGWGGLLPYGPDGSVEDTSIDLLPLWHNGYLEILSQLGIPGLLAFLMLWGRIMRVEGLRLYYSRRSQQTINIGLFVAVVTCLIYALAEQQFYRIETASHTYFLAGLLLTSGKFLNPQKAQNELNLQFRIAKLPISD